MRAIRGDQADRASTHDLPILADMSGTINDAPSGTKERTAVLVENHRAFLRYLERRIGSREMAEEILQDAFARTLDRLDELPEEALLPWFYRVLRNAVIDQVRRREVAERALAAFSREIEMSEAVANELRGEICACVGRLAHTLKPEYAEALQAIDINGVPVKTFAAEKGLSAANAGVRVFRARQALRGRVIESCGTCAEHGCLDCWCGKPGR